jgi:GNAT superfamily N-acetyltransferase
MIAVTDAGGRDRVIGYFLVRFGVSEGEQSRYSGHGLTLDTETDCTIAPSVADDCQNQGLGTLLFAHLIEVARRAGRKRMVLWGGVRGINARAIHFYTKHGFRRVGDFEIRGNNHDMLLEL